MRTYKIEAPDGKIYTVEAPDDASELSLFDFVEKTRRKEKEDLTEEYRARGVDPETTPVDEAGLLPAMEPPQTVLAKPEDPAPQVTASPPPGDLVDDSGLHNLVDDSGKIIPPVNPVEQVEFDPARVQGDTFSIPENQQESFSSKLQGAFSALEKPLLDTANFMFPQLFAFQPEKAMYKASGTELKDKLLKFGVGTGSGTRAISEVFGADNEVAKQIEGIEDDLDKMFSAVQQGKDDLIDQYFKEAEGKGTKAQVVAALNAFAADPSGLIAQGLGSTVPILAGAVLAKLAGLSAPVIGVATGVLGAAQGLGIVKGSIFDAVKQKLMEKGFSEKIANKRANAAQSYAGENLGLILTGGGLGWFATRTGLEPAFIRAMIGDAVAKGLGKQVAATAAVEFGTEAAQAGQERMAANIALQKQGFDVPTFEGVAGAATFEGLIGAGAGAIISGAIETTRPYNEDVIADREKSSINRVRKYDPGFREEVTDVEFNEIDGSGASPSVPLLGGPETTTRDVTQDPSKPVGGGVGPDNIPTGEPTRGEERLDPSVDDFDTILGPTGVYDDNENNILPIDNKGGQWVNYTTDHDLELKRLRDMIAKGDNPKGLINRVRKNKPTAEVNETDIQDRLLELEYKNVVHSPWLDPNVENKNGFITEGQFNDYVKYRLRNPTFLEDEIQKVYKTNPDTGRQELKDTLTTGTIANDFSITRNQFFNSDIATKNSEVKNMLEHNYSAVTMLNNFMEYNTNPDNQYLAIARYTGRFTGDTSLKTKENLLEGAEYLKKRFETAPGNKARFGDKGQNFEGYLEDNDLNVASDELFNDINRSIPMLQEAFNDISKDPFYLKNVSKGLRNKYLRALDGLLLFTNLGADTFLRYNSFLHLSDYDKKELGSTAIRPFSPGTHFLKKDSSTFTDRGPDQLGRTPLNTDQIMQIFDQHFKYLDTDASNLKVAMEELETARSEINVENAESDVSQTIPRVLDGSTDNLEVGDTIKFSPTIDNPPVIAKIVDVSNPDMYIVTPVGASKRIKFSVPRDFVSLVKRKDSEDTPSKSVVEKGGKNKGPQVIEIRATNNNESVMNQLDASQYGYRFMETILKETLQNSADAIKAGLNLGLIKRGKYEVTLDIDKRKITIKDNGIGMSVDVIQNAFLSLGGSDKGPLDASSSSGGKGLAKAGILTTAENFQVDTVDALDVLPNNKFGIKKEKDLSRNVVETLDTKGAMSGQPVRVNSINRNAYTKESDLPKLSNPGTTIVLNIPTKTLKGRGISLSSYSDSTTDENAIKTIPPVFTFPLLVDMDITYNVVKNNETIKSYTIEKSKEPSKLAYEKLLEVEFPEFGTAVVYRSLDNNYNTFLKYFGKAIEEGAINKYQTHNYSLKDNGKIYYLSSGLIQFGSTITSTSDMNAHGIHDQRAYIVDIKPKHRPNLSDKIYPFNPTRTGFHPDVSDVLKAAPMIESDFYKILRERHFREASKKRVGDLQGMVLLPKLGLEMIGKGAIQDYTKTDDGFKEDFETKLSFAESVPEKDLVEIPKKIVINLKGEITAVKGPIGPKLSTMLTQKEGIEIFRLMLSNFDMQHKVVMPLDGIQKPIFFNKTNLDATNTPERRAYFTEIASLVNNLVFDINKNRKMIDAELQDLGLVSAKELSQVLKTKGITDPTDVPYVGVGISKGYGGVNMPKPMYGILVNPLYTFFPRFERHKEAKGNILFKVVLHEVSHIPQRTHGNDFLIVDQLMETNTILQGIEKTYRDKFTQLEYKYEDTLKKLREEFDAKTGKNNDIPVIYDITGSGSDSVASASRPKKGDGSDSRRDTTTPSFSRKRQSDKIPGGPPTIREPSSGRKSEDAGEQTPIYSQRKSTLDKNLEAAAATQRIRNAKRKAAERKRLAKLSAKFEQAEFLEGISRALRNRGSFSAFNKKLERMLNSNYTVYNKTKKIFPFLSPRMLLEVLPRNVLGDQTMPQKPAFLRTAIDLVANVIPGMRLDILKTAEPVIEKLKDVSSKHGEEAIRDLGSVAIQATISSIDPATSRGAKAYPDLFKKYNALPKESKKAYIALRDWTSKHLDMYERILVHVATRHMRDDSYPDPNNPKITIDGKEQMKAAVAKIRAAFEDLRKKKPFFPLTRFGNYWFQIGEDADPDKAFVTETSQDKRDEFVQAYKEAKYPDMSDEQFFAMHRRGNSFIKQVLGKANMNPSLLMKTFEETINAAIDNPKFNATEDKEKLRESLLDKVRQLGYLLAPEGSLKKHYLHRDNITGASNDMLQTFTSFANQIAFQLPRLKHSPDYYENLANAVREVSGEGMPEGRAKMITQDILDEMQRRSSHLLGLTPDDYFGELSSNLTAFAFYWYLTAPGSALVNIFGGVTIALPTLGARYGYQKASAKLTEYSARTGSPTSYITVAKNAEGKDVPMLDMNIKTGFDEFVSKLGPDQQRLIKDMETDLDVSFSFDLTGISEKPVELFASNFEKAKRITAAVFHYSERFIRTATALAAFDLELERSNNYDKALAAARDLSYRALGDFTATAKAPFFIKPIPKLVLQFKQYSLLQTFNLIKDFRSSFKMLDDLTPEQLEIELLSRNLPEEEVTEYVERYKVELADFVSESRKRFMGTLVMSALVAGVRGLPFWSLLGLIYTMFSDDDDKEELIRDWDGFSYRLLEQAIGSKSADVIFNGLIESAGLGISDRLSLDLADMWVRFEPRSRSLEETVLDNVAANLGPVFAFTVTDAPAAIDDFREGNVLKGIEKLVPAFIRSPIGAYRFAEDGVRVGGPTGVSLIPASEITLSDITLKSLGITPSNIRAEQRQQYTEFKLAREISFERSELLRRYREAIIQDHILEKYKVGELIDVFNERFPAYKITQSQLSQSVKQAAQTKLRKKQTGGIDPDIDIYIDVPKIGGDK